MSRPQPLSSHSPHHNRCSARRKPSTSDIRGLGQLALQLLSDPFLFVRVQVSAYFQINPSRGAFVGILKRRKTKSYQLIDKIEMLSPNELYYLYFKRSSGSNDFEDRSFSLKGTGNSEDTGGSQHFGRHNSQEVSNQIICGIKNL